MIAKRIFDFIMAGIGLLVLSPLFLVLALLIKTTSPGPVFHRAERMGKNGDLFRLYKFRSMAANAAQVGAGITCAGDCRITPVGRVLRRCKLDELPQLINVLKGEMSLVGPRPEDPRYVARYTPEQRRVLSVRPGITSAASVHYRNEETILAGPQWEQQYLTVVLPDKLRLDLDYLDHRTFWSDIGIIRQTMAALFR